MPLRSRLFLMVAAALVPMAMFAVVAAVLLQKDERDTMARDGIGRARSAMSAIDAHLRGTLLGLRTLAASKNLEAGDIRAFHAESQRVLKGDPAWVNIGLLSRDQVLFNSVYAFGKPEPLPALEDSMEVTANGAKIAFGTVRSGNVVRNPTVRVHMPVSYDAAGRYILVAPLNIKQIAEVLQAQKLPEGWTIVLMDRNSQVIAGFPTVATGSPASDAVREALTRAPEGWSPSVSADDPPGYIAHVTSDLSGWVLAIGIPADYMDASAKRGLRKLVIYALAALAFSIVLAWLVARRIPD